MEGKDTYGKFPCKRQEGCVCVVLQVGTARGEKCVWTESKSRRQEPNVRREKCAFREMKNDPPGRCGKLKNAEWFKLDEE